MPPALPEFRFDEKRFWRFDRAWPDHKVAVEIEGGLWMKNKGAHSHPTNIIRDIEKGNAAVLAGWTVLRFAETHLQSPPYVIECLTRALKGG